MLVRSNTYLRNSNLKDLLVDKALANLTLELDNAHKRMFYLRVRSQMVVQKVFRIFDQASINKLITIKIHIERQ